VRSSACRRAARTTTAAELHVRLQGGEKGLPLALKEARHESRGFISRTGGGRSIELGGARS
jgi:hypothetical protein